MSEDKTAEPCHNPTRMSGFIASTVRVVYRWCMSRTNIDIDTQACEQVMSSYGFSTKRDAVNFALRELARVATLEEARSMRGSGWDGDLAEMRQGRLAG